MYKLDRLICCIFLLIQGVLFSSQNFKQPQWNINLDVENIEYRLGTEKIAAISLLRNNISYITGSSRKVFLVTLESGLKGIFKPRSFIENIAEVAAYKVSCFLKLYLVPPTILRCIDNCEGSFQFFVETDLSIKEQKEAFYQLPRTTRSNVYLFQFILGNYGWGPECKYDTNMIITRNHRGLNIALIDHETLFHIQKVKYGDRPFVSGDTWDQKNNWLKILTNSIPFPFNDTNKLNKEDVNNLILDLKSFNSESIILYYSLFNAEYCVWSDSIWFKNENSKTKNYTEFYSKSTLASIHELDFENLTEIFSHAFINEKSKSSEWSNEYFLLLFSLILERRNQVIDASRKGLLID